MSEMIASNERPNYLAEITPEQIDNTDLSTFAKPPRIKIVQAMTKPPIKPLFKDGDIIVLPQSIALGNTENPFTFTPIHFFPSWICLNPIQLQGQLRGIREYTLDPKSDIAKKAKSFVKEKCPENQEYYLKYNETLNFIVVVDNEEVQDIPLHLFFAAGEYKTGQILIGNIQARKAPRYACRFRSASGLHTGPKGQWYGLDITNDPQPWVAEESYHKYKKLYEDMKELIDNRALEIDLGEEENLADSTDM